jgi:hypothetical protein
VSNNILLNGHGFIKSINAESFNDIAFSVFRYQYENNEIYKAFANAVRKTPGSVASITEIPFLPVSFYKTHRVVTGNWHEELVFESSRTTGDTPASHFVKSTEVYKDSLLRGFEEFYGPVTDYTFLALLPSYLERSNASLVHMVRELIDASGNTEGGFYLNEWAELVANIKTLQHAGKKIVLIGVTFALLDFVDACGMDMHNVIVMETGGMKGRKEEWTRQQVHDFLKGKWSLGNIHSEYGMTELLSQAYAKSEGVFYPASTMKILVRDINDPFDVKDSGAGLLNIIDLANLHSCSFIATDDIGKIYENGSFEVLGRADHSALRGCSLMVL